MPKTKNECECGCDSNKESKCCCSKHKGIYIVAHVAVVLVIFLMGMCVGMMAGRFDGGFGKSFHGQTGYPLTRSGFTKETCPMMQGSTVDEILPVESTTSVEATTPEVTPTAE